VYPASIAAHPSTMKFFIAAYNSSSFIIPNFWAVKAYICPKQHPRIMPGKNKPAGTLVP